MFEVIHVALQDSFLYPRRAIERTITEAGKLISPTAELSELANLQTRVITLISPTLATQEGVSTNMRCLVLVNLETAQMVQAQT